MDVLTGWARMAGQMGLPSGSFQRFVGLRWINSRVTGHIKDAAPEWAAKMLKILQTDGCIYTDVKISLCVAEKDAHRSFGIPHGYV